MSGYIGPYNPIHIYPYTEEFTVAATYDAKFSEDSTAFNTDSQEVDQGAIVIDLTPNINAPIVGGSVRFTLNGHTYVDRDGALYMDPDPTTNAGELAGSINYISGQASITVYSTGNGTVTLQSLLTTDQDNVGAYVLFRTASSPIGTSSLILSGSFADGTSFTVTANESGDLVATDIDGHVDVDTGIVSIRFGALDGSTPPVFVERPVLFDSLTYNCVVLGYLPLDATTLGLDPTRLPVDGRVPIFRNGNVVVVHNTKTDTLASPLTAGQVVTLSRHPVSKLTIYDENGLVVDPANYTANLTTGDITFADPLDLSAYQQPLVAEHRIEDMREVIDVQIQGQLSLNQGVAFDFDTDTKISSALIFGDLGGVVQNVFTQKTWTNVFQDSRIGDDSIAKYNDVLYPIVITNSNAITERWAIIFTSNTAFEVLGEVSGIIATGTISSDTAPINPQTGQPYFTIPSGGWGTGWVSNNVLRFNTVGAAHAMWIARSIEAGNATETNDQGRVEGRGDAN